MLTKFVIERWQLSLILFAMLILLGINSLTSISRAVDPHFPIPVVAVVAVQPGADAQDMEETVAKPIEDVLQGLDDIVDIESFSTDGGVTLIVEFSKWSGDVDGYFDDVVREVSAIRDTLPENLLRLDFQKVRTTEASVIQLALVSEQASWRRMEKYAEDLGDILARVSGVRESEIHGLAEPEVAVAIRPDRLAQLGLPPSVVADALRTGGAELAAGALQSGDRRVNVEAGGAFRDLETIRRLPLRTNAGTLVTLADVATVEWTAAEQIYRTRHNGQRALFITATQKDGVDVIRLKAKLDTQLAAFRASLPPDMRLVEQFDQSNDVERRLEELSRDFLIAIGLVIVTLLPLGLRASGIVMVSIPMSLAIGLLAIQTLGFNLSQLSIAGFIVSLGLLVDDSIVVTENIARHLRMGKSRTQAAIDGTLEIRAAVIGSTFVLVFAFAPLLFMPGGAGSYTRSFFLTIMFTVMASLFVSLSLIPYLASRVLRRDEDPEGNALLKFVNGRIQALYRPLLHWALGHPWVTTVGAMLLCCSAFALVPGMGFSLFPYADTPYFRVQIETEQGSSLAQTERKVREVSAILAQEPAIKVRAENIGQGNPQVFYNVRRGAEQSNYGEVLAVLDVWKPREGEALIGRLRERFEDVVGAQVTISLFTNGAPIVAPIAIRINGPEIAEIKKLSAQVAKILRETPGARDINDPLANDRIDLDINIDEAQAALLDVPAGAARRALRLALSGETVAAYRDGEGDSYPVRVRLPLNEAQPVSALEQVYVPTRQGQLVRLSQLAQPKLISVPPQISRYQLERTNIVSAQVDYGAVPATVNQAAVARIEKMNFPPGYGFSIGGESESINETFGNFVPVVITALLLIFAILVAEFRRFRETIVVAGVIPLGTFGGILALWVTGNSMGFMAIIGFIALIGIEIKNSILLVDFTTQLRERGLGLREAIEQAGEVRFLPVLLTSVTAIGGLLPLALLGGSLYAPVAIIIIGGLVSSTLLSRIVTPVMYWLIARGAADADIKTVAVKAS